MNENERLRRKFQAAGTAFFIGLFLVVLVIAVTIFSKEQPKDRQEAPTAEYAIFCDTPEAVEMAPVLMTAVKITAEAVEEDKPYYDVPLTEELQDYIFDLSEEYGVPAEVVFAVIKTESSYRPNTVGKAGEKGLMKIHPVNFEQLEETLGITDFTDPKQNILCGVYMLSKLYAKYDTTTEVLMCYNCGERGAKNLWKKGITKTAYTEKINTAMEGLQ